jgi:hypothetical protein
MFGARFLTRFRAVRLDAQALRAAARDLSRGTSPERSPDPRMLTPHQVAPQPFLHVSRANGEHPQHRHRGSTGEKFPQGHMQFDHLWPPVSTCELQRDITPLRVCSAIDVRA